MVVKLKREIKASVRDIVDYVFSEGDILPIMVQKNNLRDGLIVHQKIQKKTSGETEVFVKYEGEIDGYLINIQGRIDILEKLNKYHIIEIKSMSHFSEITEQLAHVAQAKFYGYMLYDKFNLDKDEEIDISVLYINKYTFAEKEFLRTYNYLELENFFYDTLRKYLAFQKIIDDFQEIKLKSISTLTFPFMEYRKGQLELIENVSFAIENKHQLFICAPTGIGKSLGTIYPAVKSLKNKKMKLFYLTAKSMIKDVARDAINLMRNTSNLQIKSLIITAKDKICINDEVKCNPKDCPYAKGFYNRVNDAVGDIYQNEDDFAYETIIRYAKKHQVCPFEFQLHVALYSDIIICDYNYVFDIRVYLRRFFDVDTSNIILLIDEAHNMYDRVCQMFTSKITIDQFIKINKFIEDQQILSSTTTLINKLKQYQNFLDENKKEALSFYDLDLSIIDGVSTLLNKLESYFNQENQEEREIDEGLLNIYFDLNNFLKISEYYNEDFLVWITNGGYQITCLNPRDVIRMRTKSLLSTCFFSATLHPLDYFMPLLGGDVDSKQLIITSPFKQENLQLLINPYISTLYRDRDDTKYQIAYQIEALVKNGGKYIIFFPSYQYLELVYQVFKKITEVDAKIIKQNREMSESERNKFLKEFDELNNNLVAFAVLGGVFAEGIDLKGEKLNGVAIIGVGLPVFDDFRNELKKYFDKVYQKGYQYAYVYPGFNKILQAVGRVIRDENDKGIALLIDRRYIQNEYLKLFPKHWSHYRIINM